MEGSHAPVVSTLHTARFVCRNPHTVDGTRMDYALGTRGEARARRGRVIYAPSGWLRLVAPTAQPTERKVSRAGITSRSYDVEGRHWFFDALGRVDSQPNPWSRVRGGTTLRRIKRVRFGLKPLIGFVTIVAVLLSIWLLLSLFAAVNRPFIDVGDLGGGPISRQPNADRVRVAVEAVQRRSLERPAVSLMLNRLEHGNRDARVHAAIALGRLGPSSEKAVPALVAALQDDRDVALPAAKAIGSIGSGSERDAGEFLASLFGDQDLNIAKRVEAAECLIEIGQTARLVETMKDNQSKCLGLQAMFIGFQRPHAADDVSVAVACLTGELSNEEPLSRQFAALTLGVLGAADTVPMLRAAQTDSSVAVRQAATTAIRRINTRNKRVR